MPPRNRPVCSVLAVLLLSPGIARLSGEAGGMIRGTITVPGAADSGDAVVYIDKIPGQTFAPPARPVVLDQLQLTFVPHVLPVLVGTTVAFPNSDEVRHNVFSPSPAKLFNLGTYTHGVSRSVTFDKPGEVALLCNVHPEMSAYIVVVETPYFAVTGRDGTFEIRGVPPGSYTLKVWHEKSRSGGTPVVVGLKKAATVRLRLH